MLRREKRKSLITSQFFWISTIFTIVFSIFTIFFFSRELKDFRSDIYRKGISRGISSLRDTIEETIVDLKEDISLLSRNNLLSRYPEISDADRDELKKLFVDYIETHQKAIELFFISADNSYIASTDSVTISDYSILLEKENLSNLDSNIEIKVKNNDPLLISASKLIKNNADEPVGILACAYSLQYFNRIIMDLNLADETELGFITNKEAFLFSVNNASEEIDVTRYPLDSNSFLGIAVDFENYSISITNTEEDPWFIEAEYVDLLNGAIFYKMPKSVIEKESNRLVFIMSILIFFIIVTTSIFIILSTVFTVIRPVDSFSILLDQIMLNHDFKFPDKFLKRNDEIGRLLVAFSNVVNELNSHRARLFNQWQETGKQVKDYENLLYSILESTGEGILYIDNEGRVVFANSAVENLLGFTKSELIDNYASAICHSMDSNDFDRERCPIYRAVHYGETATSVDDQFNRKNDSNLDVLYNVNPTYKDGKLTGAVLVFQDIHMKKEMEKSLFRAKAAAIKLADTRMNFVEKISHEIRTPLNIIIGMTNLLSESVFSAEQTQYINKIKSSSSELLGMMNKVLSFSDQSGNEMLLNDDYFNPSAFLENFESNHRSNSTKERTGISLNMINPVSEIMIIGDSGLLMEILNNICLVYEENIKIEVTTNIEVNFEVQQNSRVCMSFNISNSQVDFSETDIQLMMNYKDDVLPDNNWNSVLKMQYIIQQLDLIGAKAEIFQKSDGGTEVSFSITFPILENQGNILTQRKQTSFDLNKNKKSKTDNDVIAEPADLLNLLRKVEKYLDQDDTTVMAFIDEIDKLFLGTSYYNDAELLIGLIQEYDFENALPLVRQLITSIG